jgi:hypothetical protein
MVQRRGNNKTSTLPRAIAAGCTTMVPARPSLPSDGRVRVAWRPSDSRPITVWKRAKNDISAAPFAKLAATDAFST